MSNSHKGISRKSKRKELALKRFPIEAESRIPFTDGIKNEFRTPRVNSIFALIADLASVSELKKIGQPDKIDQSLHLVARTGLLADSPFAVDLPKAFVPHSRRLAFFMLSRSIKQA